MFFATALTLQDSTEVQSLDDDHRSSSDSEPSSSKASMGDPGHSQDDIHQFALEDILGTTNIYIYLQLTIYVYTEVFI